MNGIWFWSVQYTERGYDIFNFLKINSFLESSHEALFRNMPLIYLSKRKDDPMFLTKESVVLHKWVYCNFDLSKLCFSIYSNHHATAFENYALKFIWKMPNNHVVNVSQKVLLLNFLSLISGDHHKKSEWHFHWNWNIYIILQSINAKMTDIPLMLCTGFLSQTETTWIGLSPKADPFPVKKLSSPETLLGSNNIKHFAD